MLALLALCLAQQPGPEVLWNAPLGVGAVGSVRDLAPAPGGGVYVGGYATPNPDPLDYAGTDAVVARFDKDGNVLWTRLIASPEIDVISALAADEAGGVFFGGGTSAALLQPVSGLADAFVGRIDAQGNTVWLRQFDADGADGITGATPDGHGGCIVTGVTDAAIAAPSAGGRDTWYARFDSGGNLLWRKQLAGISDDTNARIELGPGGTFFLSDSSFGATSLDWRVGRFSVDTGDPLWIKLIGDPDESDSCRDLASDGEGGVFVTGPTTGNFGGAGFGFTDIAVAHLDGAGNLLWVTRRGSPGIDFPWAVASDGTGGVLLAASTSDSLSGPVQGERDAYLARIDSDGTFLWETQYGTAKHEVPWAIQADREGGFYFAFYEVINNIAGGLGLSRVTRFEPGPIGETYCTGLALNSTGAEGVTRTAGSELAAQGRLDLFASALPADTFGIFLASLDAGFVPMAFGSAGTLCLSPAFGRFDAPGQIQSTGSAGAIELSVDTDALPTATGPVGAAAGQTWHFQAWHRDLDPAGGMTSNFAAPIRVLFR